jgi:anti-sigma factor RsiW
MNHDNIRHRLSEYIDDALTLADRSEVEQHLKTCAECSAALNELRKTIDQIKTIEEVDAPAWMTQKIMANVRAKAEKKQSLFAKTFSLLRLLPVQAVAVLFLTITAYYVYQNMQPTKQASEAPMEEARSAAPANTPAKEEVKIAEGAARPKQLPQTQGYRALDMKPEYEKPAPPVPSTQIAAAPAPTRSPEKQAEQFSATKKEVAPASDAIKMRAAEPAKTSEKPIFAEEGTSVGNIAAPQGGAPAITQKQAMTASAAASRSKPRKDFATTASKAKTSYTNRDEIISIFKKLIDLNNDLIGSTSPGVGKSGKSYVESYRELEKFSEKIYNPALDSAKNLICANRDDKLLLEFVKVLIATEKSADEAPRWTLGDIYLCQPKMVAAVFKKFSKEQQKIVYDDLSFGFDNVTYKKEHEISNYSQLKKQLESLNPEN